MARSSTSLRKARHATLAAQQRQLDAAAEQRLELQAVADGIEAFCPTIRVGLATATFAQRRQLAEFPLSVSWQAATHL